MIKLYYSAGSCSTSCHISLEEAGLQYQATRIDWDRTEDPNVERVLRLNPLGTLPVALISDRGSERILSQNVAIHTYIAEQVPERKLLPPPASVERAEAMNWLSFVAADLHKAFAPLFGLESMIERPEIQQELRRWHIENIQEHLAYLEKGLAGKEYLMGSQFTVADAYCFVVTNWANAMEIPISQHQNVIRYLQRVSQRPAVQKVLREEGLLEQAA